MYNFIPYEGLPYYVIRFLYEKTSKYFRLSASQREHGFGQKKKGPPLW